MGYDPGKLASWFDQLVTYFTGLEEKVQNSGAHFNP